MLREKLYLAQTQISAMGAQLAKKDGKILELQSTGGSERVRTRGAAPGGHGTSGDLPSTEVGGPMYTGEYLDTEWSATSPTVRRLSPALLPKFSGEEVAVDEGAYDRWVRKLWRFTEVDHWSERAAVAARTAPHW